MIRRATKDDIQEIFDLCRAQVGRGDCVWSDEYPCMDNFTFDQANNNLFAFFVEGDAKIAGCLSIESPNDLEEMDEVELHGDLAIEISRVAIRTDLQGKGLATKMVNEFIDLMRQEGIRAIQLLVAKSNPAAITTYANAGFIIKGECFMFGHDYYIAEIIIGDIEIRAAGANDLDGLLALYQDLHDNKIPEDLAPAQKAWTQIMADSNHRVIVAVRNSRIVSSVVCVIVPNLTHDQRPYALIENVVTASDFRGQGLATKCLNYAYTLALSKNCYKLMLLTGAKDEKTLNFYRNANYNSNDKTAFIRWIK